MQANYDAGVTDEFLEPIVVDERPALDPDNTAIIFNFRPDRGRQLAAKLIEAGLDVTTMTSYSSEFDVPVVFDEEEVRWTLAETLAAAKLDSSTSRRPRSTRTSCTFSSGVEDE